ncbi:MAG: hypothetical protein F4090_06510, partial [Nitrospira sp. SB0672_bin_25]|nr:hypothetical protein [Nitrospira sp. SB0672_bin_25]
MSFRKRRGLNLPATALAIGFLGLVLSEWFEYQNTRLDDHLVHAAGDGFIQLAVALDHFGHDRLRRPVAPTLPATERALTTQERTAFLTHEATPPWFNLDDLEGEWGIRFLVHYPAGSLAPHMIVYLDPSNDRTGSLSPDLRNILIARSGAMTSQGVNSDRDPFAGQVRAITGNVLGTSPSDDDLAFFTWPLVPFETRYVFRETRAGIGPAASDTDLGLGGHDLKGVGSASLRELNATDLQAGTALVSLEDVTTTGNVTTRDIEVKGRGTIAGQVTITEAQVQALALTGELEVQGKLTAIAGEARDVVVEGAVTTPLLASPTGSLTITGDM